MSIAIDSTLLGATFGASLLCAAVGPVHDRRVAVAATLFNFVLVGGTWGAISFLINGKTAFVLLEMWCFALYGVRWRAPWLALFCWLALGVITTALHFLYSPDAFSMVFAVLFAVYTRLAAWYPARLTTLIFEGVPSTSAFLSLSLSTRCGKSSFYFLLCCTCMHTYVCTGKKKTRRSLVGIHT